MIPMYINISEIQDFTRCRFRWWAKWVMNRVPKHDAQPLAFGKLGHLIFEYYHNNGSTPGAMTAAITKYKTEWQQKMEHAGELGLDISDISIGTKVLAQLDDLTEALVQWHEIYPTEYDLEIEQPFEFDLGNGVICRGRPDRVFVRQNTIWHKQHKFLAPSTHFAVFTDLAKRSYHEHMYAEALFAKYAGRGLQYGGTEFDLIRKLKYRTNITAKNPAGKTKEYEEMFQQIPMNIDLSSPVHAHIMDSIRQHAENMKQARKEWEEKQIIPAPSEGMNGGMFGNKPDEFFRVLVGELELDDARYFKNREDTYAPSEGTEEE